MPHRNEREFSPTFAVPFLCVVNLASKLIVSLVREFSMNSQRKCEQWRKISLKFVDQVTGFGYTISMS